MAAIELARDRDGVEIGILGEALADGAGRRRQSVPSALRFDGPEVARCGPGDKPTTASRQR